MARRLSEIFPSTRSNRRSHPLKHCSAGVDASASTSTSTSTGEVSGEAAKRAPGRRRGGGRGRGKALSPWCVYLIVSSRLPKSYVGVTTNFPRRLKQHNGELKGGAKASSAGRPWICACIVRGFKDKSAGKTKDSLCCEGNAIWACVTTIDNLASKDQS